MPAQPETCNNFFLDVPATILFIGPSGSGKSTEVVKLCENWSQCTRNNQQLSEVYLFYETYQTDLYKRIEKSAQLCHFKQGFPEDLGFLEDSKNTDSKQGRVVILDDLAHTLDRNRSNLEKLFTVASHHTGK